MDEVIFRTSGSTGSAKTIVRTEASLQADAAALVATFPEVWSGRPPVVASIPTDHLYGALWRVRAPACAGSVVEPQTVLSAEDLLAARARYGRFLFVTTPSFLEKRLLHPDAAGLAGAFVAIVTSGSLLRAETSRAVTDRLGTCPLEIYGSTETGTVACRRQCAGEDWTLVPSVDAVPAADGALTVSSPFALAPTFTLADAVRFVGPRRFRLLGRTDRQVKILEQLVSLPAVEEVLEAHPLVAKARVEAVGTDVPRLGALLVLTPEGNRLLSAGTHAALVSRLRRELLPTLGPTAFPRRIRLVRTLPEDARGKTTAAAVRASLGLWCREPAVTDWVATADRLEATLVFPPDCECFDGHFPGLPILPGVAQLYFLRHFATQAFSDFPSAATYRRLKFQKLVFPGRPVSLAVTRLSEGVFEFTLAGATGSCASGRIERTVP